MMMPKLLRILKNRYIIICPVCGGELNWYASSSQNYDLLLCLNCSTFSKKQPRSGQVEAVEVPEKLNEIFTKQDQYHRFYVGTPSSEFYMPNWLRTLDKICKTLRLSR